MNRYLAAVFLGAFCLAGQGSDPTSEAAALIRAGNFNKAHQIIEASLAQSKTDPRLCTLDGLALSRLGRTKEAIAAYQDALAIAPRYLPALEGAAELNFKERSSDAIDSLRRLLQVRPDEPTAHAMLATLAFEHGDCVAAEREFSQSEAAIVSQPSSLEARGACLLQLKRPAEAARSFLALTKQNPDEARYHCDLALSQIAAGSNRDAIATLNAIPAHRRGARSLDLMADAYEQLHETPAAVSALREAIVLEPQNSAVYLHFADLCLAHHSFQAGVEMLNSGIGRSPRTAQLYLARGILQVQLAQYAEAEQDFAKAEQLDPDTRYAAALQGMTKLQQNQLEPAAAEIRQRVQQNPHDAFLQYLLAETLARGGAVPGTLEFADAVTAAQTAIVIQPRFALARDVLGRLYLQKGDVPAAVRESRLAFADDPTDQTALYHLIRALRKAGDDREIPELTRKLAALREQSQRKEIEERRFAIVVNAAQPSR